MAKTVIITGASSGIGLACAQLYLNRGYNVMLAARRIDALQEATQGFNPNQFAHCITDVSNKQDCANLINATVQRFGQIDTLINNAGISMRALFNAADIEILEKVMQVNFWGSVYCTKYALPHIIKSKGSIVGVSSVAGYRGLPGRTGYSASKFAMNGFLESLRTELLYKGVNVLTVCPGFTKSAIREHSLTADGSAQGISPREEEKMMTSKEVALHIYNAINKRKRTLILTRQGKLTVFMNKWLPKWMDKKVFQVMAKEPNSPFNKNS